MLKIFHTSWEKIVSFCAIKNKLQLIGKYFDNIFVAIPRHEVVNKDK